MIMKKLTNITKTKSVLILLFVIEPIIYVLCNQIWGAKISDNSKISLSAIALAIGIAAAIFILNYAFNFIKVNTMSEFESSFDVYLNRMEAQLKKDRQPYIDKINELKSKIKEMEQEYISFPIKIQENYEIVQLLCNKTDEYNVWNVYGSYLGNSFHLYVTRPLHESQEQFLGYISKTKEPRDISSLRYVKGEYDMA